MLATSLQFGFLLFVAVGNLWLGFLLARQLARGSMMAFSPPSARSRRAAASDSPLAKEADEYQTESNCSGERTEIEPTEVPSPDDTVNEVRDVAKSAGAEDAASGRCGMAALALLDENRETLLDIVAGLLQAGESLTSSTLEAAASKTIDVGQRLQQRLNSTADLLRPQHGDPDRRETDMEAAESLEGLWETINEALLGLVAISFAEESLDVTLQKLTETIQTIADASQIASAQLDETLLEVQENGLAG